MADTRKVCQNCNFANSEAAESCINCGSKMTELPFAQRKQVGDSPEQES